MNIYEKAEHQLSSGAHWSIDLKKRSLRVGHKYLIEDGKYENELGDYGNTGDTVADVERLFLLFQSSIPSQRSQSQKKSYFHATPLKDLSTEDMLFGEGREMCRFRLEMYILCSILDGSFNIPFSGWFWRSERVPELVIKHEWVS